MTELVVYLERLGLEQYLDAFVGEGFDTIDTLLDIQESDFDALNVKLGHRRKLQRAIAEHRGIPFERLVATSPYEASPDGARGLNGPPVSSAGSANDGSGGGETKRKYRRHPKPDDNAPEKPPSAYVIFSNKVREEVKERNLVFTQIAKLVGERWQKLGPEAKEPYEVQANGAKERYNIQLSTYKKTDAYKEYMKYLADFKSKHGRAADQKRPKLEPESSGSIISAKSFDLQPELLTTGQGGHIRGGSTGSMDSTTYATVMPSPVAFGGLNLPPQISQPATAYSQRGSITASRGDSPSGRHPGRDLRRPGKLSNQSSVSDESPIVRSDSDPLGRTASLSLSTPPSATPPLLSLPGSGLLDHGAGHDSSRRFDVLPLQSATSGFGLKSSGGAGLGNTFSQPLSSPATSEVSWRGRPLDLRGYTDPARAMQPPSLLASGAPSGAISLPPLIGPDRFSDHQRMLPLPRTSPTTQQQTGLALGARLTESPSPYHFGATPRVQQGQGAPLSPRDRPESDAADAADALAGLAAGGSRSNTARPSDTNWGRR